MPDKKEYNFAKDLASALCDITNEHLEEDEKISWDPEVTDLEVDARYSTYSITFAWNCNLGFGELVIWKSEEDGSWHYDDEGMGKEFCKLVINKWAETIFDNGSCED